MTKNFAAVDNFRLKVH